MNWRKRIPWIVSGLALALTGFYVLLASTLWNIEQLDSPVLVRSVTATHLILEDRRTITLPLIKELPHDNPMFKEAIKDGIEVGTNGEVYCLNWIDPTAPQIPFWQKRRVNLSFLAGVLYPARLDESRIDPKWFDSCLGGLRMESIQTYGNRECRLLGFHWSWLRSIQEDLQRNIRTNPSTE